MNEIIIHEDGTRTICDEDGHALAFSPHWAQIENMIEPDRFYVLEAPIQKGDIWILKAVQSTVRGAYSYMSPFRVLVYRHESKEGI